VIGLDDYTAGQPDLGLLSMSTTASRSVTSVLVQHSPGFFDQGIVTEQMKSRRFDLCLAGHTHGGQVALLGWAPIKPVGSGRFTAGFYALEFVIISRIIDARVSGGRFLDAFLHPISTLMLIYLIIYSWIARGKVQWKGRTL
jgi:hypothetical protein